MPFTVLCFDVYACCIFFFLSASQSNFWAFFSIFLVGFFGLKFRFSVGSLSAFFFCPFRGCFCPFLGFFFSVFSGSIFGFFLALFFFFFGLFLF